MTNSLVLIPSSRFVDVELQLEVGKIPPVLIPVNGRPLLASIVERYQSLPGNSTFAVIVNQGQELIEQLVERDNTLRQVKLISVASEPDATSLDLGQTIRASLKQIDLTQFDGLYLNFGDTLVDADLVPEKDAVYYDDLHESFRWTTFKEIAGQLQQIVDKFVHDSTGIHHTFAGVFHFKDLTRFQHCLSEANSQSEIGSFYSALQQYAKGTPLQLVKVTNWYDFGHVDNYYQAKKRFVNKRFFNQIEIDEQRAVVTKTSTNVDKFVGEIRWYLELPAALRCYTPQIFDYSLERKRPFVKMEYYGYPTISELFLFGGHTLGIWSHVFEAVFNVISEMRRYQLSDDQKTINDTLYEMYVQKTRERLDHVLAHPILSALFDKPITINGSQYQPLSHYLDQLDILFDRYLLNTLNSVSVIHGDLCISNILYDPRSRIIKVLDPRGKFGEYTIYWDYRYELAKLSHSFNGHYESIIHDKYFSICEKSTLNYEIFLSDYQRRVTQLFNQRLSNNYSHELGAVNLIEALLFLGMTALHSDHLDRQIVMLATGIEKLDRICHAAITTGSV